MARLLSLAVAAVVGCAVLRCSPAFVSGPQLRGEAAWAAAAGAAAVASAPGSAEAFVYNGKEYFDITFGISPFAWAFAGFSLLFYGATLKNAALKYNQSYGTGTVQDPAPIIGKGAKFVGAEVEFPGANTVVNAPLKPYTPGGKAASGKSMQ
mmetsp:Transcript_75683/g.191354  ORF Transcript_75683/g.191354 Transcript_75683/m.191354 type:complete len:152 (+) Transcript_75683:65-520(+)